MTEILFAKSAGKKAYVVRGIEMAITSLEEFGYFYAKHIIFLDSSIMQEDFEDWIATELDNRELAGRLRQIRENKESCIVYFAWILDSVVIFSEEEKENIIKKAKEFVNKNDNQKRKLLGDQLFVREKYEGAIKEYYSLTRAESFLSESHEFIGNVWHNLGCCYGMCFMFDKALECFKEAYSYSFSQATQNAVTYIVKLQQEDVANKQDEKESFLNYLNYTAQTGRDNRHEQLGERMKAYRKGVEE